MDLKRTPLYKVHEELGATFVDFAGWEMPLKYGVGEKKELLAVRSASGLFDVSHMGEVLVKGPGAFEAVQRLTTNDLSRITDGQCQYTLICNDRGGTVDDTIVYRFSDAEFLFCVNASNTVKAFEWISAHAHADGDVTVEDVSGGYAQIALQGPTAGGVLSAASFDLASLKPFYFIATELFGCEALVSRTGYTGEDGVEIYTAPEGASHIWRGLMEAGKGHGILPCGLVARDNLRLEMGYPLYGNELDEETSPIEASLKGFVSFNADFIGKEALEIQSKEGTAKKLVGIEMVGRGIGRRGDRVMKDGAVVGEVTSGTFSVALGAPVAMAYVPPTLANLGTELHVDIRGKGVAARVTRRPFYRGVARSTTAAV